MTDIASAGRGACAWAWGSSRNKLLTKSLATFFEEGESGTRDIKSLAFGWMRRLFCGQM